MFEALPLLNIVSPAIFDHITTLTHPSIAATLNDSPGISYEELSGPTIWPSQLDEGEVWVEYHPASGKRPEILRPQGLAHRVDTPVMSFDATMPAWHPFRTRADFEQAELFLRYDCTDSYINGQLKLIHSSSPLGHSITLESAKEMHDTLAQIPRIEDLPGVRVSNGILTIIWANFIECSSKQLILKFHILNRKTVAIQFVFERPSSPLFLIFSRTTICRIVFACTQNVDIYGGLVLQLASCGFGKKTHLVTTGGMFKFVSCPM